MKTKNLDLKLYSPPREDGYFSGYAAIFGSPDAQGEIILPGAFAESLRARDVVSLLWNHDSTQPIGVARCAEDDRGLVVFGYLNQDVQLGREIRSSMQKGVVRGLSIGYQVLEEKFDRESGARILKKIKLWEISACVFPVSPEALVNDVKSDDAIITELKKTLACMQAKIMLLKLYVLKDKLNSIDGGTT